MDTIIEQREYSYAEVTNKLFELATLYNFINVYSIGKSLTGRPIYAARIGAANNTVLYVGGTHGSERLTTLTLMIFLDRFSRALQNNTDFSISNARNALFGKSIIIVPCINPDGYEIAQSGASTAGNMVARVNEIAGNTDLKYWNANARGVDINHNFDAGFDKMKEIELQQGITGPQPRKYGGTATESEPETQALVELCNTNYIAQALSFHSQGEEIYWQYGENTPPKSLKLAELYSTASGYAVSQPEPSASYAGFKDWFIDKFAQPGFTLEIGKGTNPLDPLNLYSIYENLEELLLLSVTLS